MWCNSVYCILLSGYIIYYRVIVLESRPTDSPGDNCNLYILAGHENTFWVWTQWVWTHVECEHMLGVNTCRMWTHVGCEHIGYMIVYVGASFCQRHKSGSLVCRQRASPLSKLYPPPALHGLHHGLHHGLVSAQRIVATIGDRGRREFGVIISSAGFYPSLHRLVSVVCATVTIVTVAVTPALLWRHMPSMTSSWFIPCDYLWWVIMW